MAKPIVIQTPEFKISYNNNFQMEIVYQIRGIEGRHTRRLDEIMHPFIVEFLTGRKARRIFHKGCAARKWRNPIAEYVLFIKEKQEKAQKMEIAKKAIVTSQGGAMNSPTIQFIGGLLDGKKVSYFRDAGNVEVFAEDGDFVGWFGEIYRPPMTARDTYEERTIPVKKGDLVARVAHRCKKTTSHPEIVSIPIEGWK